MLPDAGYRLKWTYGVEAFQQWCNQRNRPILSASTEGISFFFQFQINNRKFSLSRS